MAGFSGALLFAWVAIIQLVTSSNAYPSTNIEDFDAKDVIYRDVAVIGGGSSGCYTAVRLGDYNKSVVVVEPQNHLGGHAETYVDPLNGYASNIGVVVFAQIKTVTDYFSRFNVPLVKLSTSGSGSGSGPIFADFSTGRTIKGYTPPSATQMSAALQAYAVQLQKYPALQESFNMTYPVQSDLLLPFGEFAQKYNLSGMMRSVFLYNQGYAPLLNISTLYMLKYLNQDEVNSINNGFLTTLHHNTQELYENILSRLGSNAYLNSSVLAMDRSNRNGQVRVLIQTPAGRKLIVAKKLVSTAPPLLSNLRNYDLSANERNLFGQFYANGYYTGILNNTGLPYGTEIQNVQPGQPYDTPKLPGTYTMSFNPAINMTQVYFGSSQVLSVADAQSEIIAELNRYKKANGLSTAKSPDWVIFSSHAPFNLMVSNKAIQNGFYKSLFALQGQRNTFYNGAAWHTQDSSALWKFTDEYVLPILLASFR